jgi:hypothetical protein
VKRVRTRISAVSAADRGSFAPGHGRGVFAEARRRCYGPTGRVAERTKATAYETAALLVGPTECLA